MSCVLSSHTLYIVAWVVFILCNAWVESFVIFKKLPVPTKLSQSRLGRLQSVESISEPELPNDVMGLRESEIGTPPDLPSLLLHNRIIYIGSSLIPAMTELVVAQLLYLDKQASAHSPITLYINSAGTNAPDNRAFSFDHEAFAIADTMQFIRAPIHTVCVGRASGTAALLLALGSKGHRCALPHAQIDLSPPRVRARGSAAEIAIKARESSANFQTTVKWLAQACGRSDAELMHLCSRTLHLSAEDAVSFGLVDQVLYPEQMQVDVSAVDSDLLSRLLS